MTGILPKIALAAAIGAVAGASGARASVVAAPGSGLRAVLNAAISQTAPNGSVIAETYSTDAIAAPSFAGGVQTILNAAFSQSPPDGAAISETYSTEILPANETGGLFGPRAGNGLGSSLGGPPGGGLAGAASGPGASAAGDAGNSAGLGQPNNPPGPAGGSAAAAGVATIAVLTASPTAPNQPAGENGTAEPADGIASVASGASHYDARPIALQSIALTGDATAIEPAFRPAAVPEPATLPLFAATLVMLAAVRLRRNGRR